MPYIRMELHAPADAVLVPMHACMQDHVQACTHSRLRAGKHQAKTQPLWRTRQRQAKMPLPWQASMDAKVVPPPCPADFMLCRKIQPTAALLQQVSGWLVKVLLVYACMHHVHWPCGAITLSLNT